MVCYVRATLTEEDWNDWRRAAARQAGSVRKKRRTAVLGWAGSRILSLAGMSAGVRGLYAVSADGGEHILMCILYSFLFPPILIGSILVFVLNVRPPKRTVCLPGRGFSSFCPVGRSVQAAFFEDGWFAFCDSSERTRLEYRSIAGVWETEECFCLFFEDRPPLLLPKRGFCRWTPEDVRDFLERELRGRAPLARIK